MGAYVIRWLQKDSDGGWCEQWKAFSSSAESHDFEGSMLNRDDVALLPELSIFLGGDTVVY